MASVTDLVKFAVSNAVGAANAAKTAGSTKVTTGGSTKKTASSGGSSGGSSGSTTGIYGVPDIGKNKKFSGGIDMSRRKDLAGKTATSNGFTVYYDEDGYATKAKRGVTDYTPHQPCTV